MLSIHYHIPKYLVILLNENIIAQRRARRERRRTAERAWRGRARRRRRETIEVGCIALSNDLGTESAGNNKYNLIISPRARGVSGSRKNERHV